MINSAAVCARSAITDMHTTAYRPLHLEPSMHHVGPGALRMGALTLTEQAPPAAMPEAVAAHEDDVLLEESPICAQPVRTSQGPTPPGYSFEGCA